MKTNNEQLRMLLHPDQYTDEQLDEMLNETIIPVPDIDAEWKKFKSERLISPNESRLLPKRGKNIRKLAAAVIGLLMLSGIAYAAVQMVRQNKVGGDLESPTPEVQISNSQQQQAEAQPTDSIVQPRIFENTPLDEMVSEIALYYNKVVDIQTEQVHELRLYYKWDPKATLESVVADLNHFDRVNLAIEDDKLIVRP